MKERDCLWQGSATRRTRSFRASRRKIFETFALKKVLSTTQPLFLDRIMNCSKPPDLKVARAGGCVHHDLVAFFLAH
ncbi:MAG: hypothetical protein QOD33_969 [Pyrinomonadaceae bacterium]|nr:hypothetical protein [Pyrinomonadaceae bacterium]